MGCASKLLEMFFELCSMVFNTFNKVEKYLSIRIVCLSVRPSQHALAFENVLQMSLHLYIILISDVEWSVLKMIYMGLRVCLQTHTQVFRYSSAYGEGSFFIATYLYCTEYCMKLTYFIELYKSLFRIQNHTKYF